MSVSRKLLIFASAVMLFQGHSLAQSGPVATQCAPEIAKYCADKTHGDGSVRSCLEDNRAQLSSDCQQALDTTGGGMRSSMTIMSPDEIAAKLKEQGYGSISKIEVESGKHYEVNTVDASGNRVELYVDGITGKVVSSERDD